MFVWASIPEAYQEMGSIEFAIQCLKKAEVAVAPGRGFGEDGENYLRIALVPFRYERMLSAMSGCFPL